jgi:tripartite-type tricarboxylate transporter receptor subunit TctC
MIQALQFRHETKTRVNRQCKTSDFDLTCKHCFIEETFMHSTRRTAIAGAAALAATALAPSLSFAQAYPSKQVSIVVSYPAGGDTDALGRVFAEKLSARLGQQVVVENKPGASGTIGNAFVAKAPADGHTLLMTPSTISSALLVLKPGTGGAYDTVGDFAPVFHMGTQQLFLVVNSQTGIKDVKGLIASAKEGKIKTYGSPGSGSPMHILGEMFNSVTGTKIQQVPYRGSAPAVTDLIGNHISFMYTTLGPVRQHIERGTLTNIGVADNVRSPFAPSVPTLEEQGVRGANLGAWQGIMAPKNTPQRVIDMLNGHMNDIMKMPDVQARMALATTVPTGGEPRYLGRTHEAEYNRMAKIIADMGIKAE